MKKHPKQKPNVILLQSCKFFNCNTTYCPKKKHKVSILNCYYCQILERPTPFEPLKLEKITKTPSPLKKLAPLDSFYNLKKK